MANSRDVALTIRSSCVSPNDYAYIVSCREENIRNRKLSTIIFPNTATIIEAWAVLYRHDCGVAEAVMRKRKINKLSKYIKYHRKKAHAHQKSSISAEKRKCNNTVAKNNKAIAQLKAGSDTCKMSGEKWRR